MRSTYPAAAALLTFLLMLTAPTQAATEVDLALVLAVDISNSMDREEQELQRQGFVEAFRSPPVHDAIAGGALGRIAVVYMEWAANYRRNVVVPWTVIEGPESAADFASRLDQAPIDRGTPHIDLRRHRFRRRTAAQQRRRGHPASHRRVGGRSQQPGPDGRAGPRRGSGQGHHHQRPADHAEARRRLLGRGGARSLLPGLRDRRRRRLSRCRFGKDTTSRKPSAPRSSGRSQVTATR